MQASIGPKAITTLSFVDDRGQIVEQFSIEHTKAGWRQWRERIARYEGNLAVCIEMSQGIVIEQLLQSEATVYPVQPRNASDTGSVKSPVGTRLISMTLGPWLTRCASMVTAGGRYLSGAGPPYQ
jgi:hypothetical protein